MGMNTIKTIKSGPLVEAICYSQAMGHEPPAVRKAKQQEATRARKWQNQKQAAKTLERSLATNFVPSDLFVTLTFGDGYLPADRAGAQKAYTRFIERVRPEFKKLGVELKYIYCIESVPDGPGMPRRLHIHAVINGGERGLEVIRAKWRAGQVHAEPLLDRPMDDYAPRALYMVKERAPDVEGRKARIRGWTPSKNLDKPIVTTERVPDTQTITAPPGAHILDSGGGHNIWGMHEYLKYLLPVDQRPAPPGRKMNTDSNNFLEAQVYKQSRISTGGKMAKKKRQAPKGRRADADMRWRKYWNEVDDYEYVMESLYKPDDLYVTLAYDDKHYPKSLDAAIEDRDHLIRQMQRATKKEGGFKFECIAITEMWPEGPRKPVRLHHHFALDGGEPGDIMIRLIRSKWRAGQVSVKPLLDDVTDTFRKRAIAWLKESEPGFEKKKGGTPWID